jgi:ferredoxin
VREEMCRGCGDCVEACPYDIPSLREVAEGKMVSSIDLLLCRGCGSCAAQCPTGAIEQGHFSEEAIGELLSALDPNGDGPKSVRLSCRWSIAAEPKPMKDDYLTIMVPCASRLHPGVILQAFRRGAKEVLVTGCGEDGCKYGALATAGGHSVNDAVPLMELLGIATDRFRVERPESTERDVHALHR